jgi:hypothetical protein
MSGSLLTQTSPYLPNPPVEQINQQLEYLSGNQPLQALDSRFIKVTPANGGTFNKQSNMIEFRIPKMARSFIDGTQTKLNVTLEIKPVVKTAETVAYGCYATGSFQNAISRFEVLSSSGEVLENIINYNRNYYPLSQVYCSSNQLLGAGSIVDLYSTPADNNPGGQAGGTKLTDATDPAAGTAFTVEKQTLSIPISLSSLFGPGANKAIPVGLMSEGLHCRLYLTTQVPEMYYSMAASTATVPFVASYDATSDYSVTNVSMEIKALTYSRDGFSMIEKNIGRGMISWNANQFISNTANVAPNANNANVLLPNTNYRDVKAIILSTYYSDITANTFTFASLQSGLYKYNVLVNGDTYFNGRSIGNNNTDNLNNSRAEFVMNLLALQQNSSNYWEANSQIATQYRFGLEATSIATAPNFTAYGGNLQTNTGPSTVPNCTIASLNGGYGTVSNGVNGSVTPPYMYAGISCLKSTDKSRRLVGTDLRGRQVVVNLERWTTIPNTTKDDILHTCMTVGVKFELDPKTGVIRRIC